MKPEFIKYHLNKALEENKSLSFLQKKAIEEAIKKLDKGLYKDSTKYTGFRTRRV